MTQVDTEFATNLIKEGYQNILEKLPSSNNIEPGAEFNLDSECNMKACYEIPPQRTFEYIECYPCKQSFIMLFVRLL
jgi:hypothetical protein